MAVIIRGDREISQRFETFPTALRASLSARIRALTDELYARVEAVVPRKTGKLASEIVARVYDDSPTRVAGYVSVYAPGDSREYPKAASLEYGTNKARRRFSKTQTIINRRGKTQRAVERLSRPVHLAARRYLRGPLQDMGPEVRTELEAAVQKAVDDAEAATS